MANDNITLTFTGTLNKDPDDWAKENKLDQGKARERAIETYRPDYNL